MPTTEIVVARLKPGSDIGDSNNAAAKALKKASDTLWLTDGMRDIKFATQIENPDTLQMFIEWDKIESHEAFMQAEVYTPFKEGFLSALDGSTLRLIHVDFKPEGGLVKAVSAPVTEVATFYFDGDAPSDYLEGVSKFQDVMVKENMEGFLGAAVGVTYEDDNEREGVKGKAAVLAIGWTTVDAHMAFRETSTFKENVGLLRNGVQKAEMHHVQFLSALAD